MKESSSSISNYMLFLASLGITYLILELFVFRAFLPLMPLKFHAYLGDLYTLVQSSKARLAPNDYIALVGDSYAQGKGDWLHSADPNRNGPFHSAHVINEKTGRDVITFGKGGAGSIDGIMINPIRNFSRINSSWLYALERPKTLVVYFYEGNDLNNNLRTINKHVMSEAGDSEMDRDQELDVFVKKHYGKAAASGTGVLGYAFVIRFLSSMTRETVKDFANDFLDRADAQPNVRQRRKKTAGMNKARVAGAIVPIPDALQSPGMELNDDEIRMAVQVFELALAELHRFFPDARLIVTIIPAPLTVYELASDNVTIQTYENRANVYPAAEVEQKSNRICKLVAASSRRAGAEFIDIRGTIHSVARQKIIHGPKDWKHFNKEGYVALGNILSAHLEKPGEPSAGCAPH
jgi:hypothetical protein